MRARIAAMAVGFLILSSVIFVGVVCAAFAIDTALDNALGVAGAAAVTAVVFLIVPCGWVMIALLRRPDPKKHTEEIVGSVVSSLLRNSSLYAILGAGLLGLTEAFLRRKKK